MSCDQEKQEKNYVEEKTHIIFIKSASKIVKIILEKCQPLLAIPKDKTSTEIW